MKLITLKFCLSIALLCSFQFATAQLGLCNGNSGPAIFTEDFGTGLTNGPELALGVTNYIYSDTTFRDGEYTISSSLPEQVSDRTPGDINGKALLVNAAFSPGVFYEKKIPGLCINTTYEFSAWLANLFTTTRGTCYGGVIPKDINVKFEILDANTGTILAGGDTGDIPGTPTPEWTQHGLVFKTSSDTVILRMINNGSGGCGNDLAIDDIVFKTCGDTFDIIDGNGTTSNIFCEENINNNNQVVLNANPNGVVFTTYAYQWQQSSDTVTWTDIAGTNNQIYIPNRAIGELYYRVIAAEVAGNLNNNSCNVISDVYKITINPSPNAPVYTGPGVEYCEDSAIAHFATVMVNAGETVDWYDAATSGTRVAQDVTSYADQITTVGTRTYYAETVNQTTGCVSKTRTAVDFTIHAIPATPLENLSFCPGSTTTLSAGVNGADYLWSTGETTQDINVSTADTYTVVVTNANNCSSTKTIVLSQNAAATTTVNENFCAGTTITLSAGVNGANYLWNTGETTQDINVSTADTYTVEITVPNACTTIEEIVLSENALPNAPTSNGDAEICINSHVFAIATVTVNTGETADWYDALTGGTRVSQNTISYTDTTTKVGTRTFYAETVNTTTGCISGTRTPVNFTVHAIPATPLENLSFCPGSTITLSAGVNGADYLWSTGETTQDINVSTADTYTVVVTNANKCSSTKTIVLSQNAAATTTVNENFCAGTTITLSAGVNGANYLWSTGETTQDINVSTADTYTVEITVPNACTTIEEIVLSENALPNAPTSNGHVEICENSGTPNTATVTVNAGEIVNWYDAATSGTLVAQDVTSYTDPDTSVGSRTFYAETVNQTTGCVSKTRTSVNFTVYPNPNAPISNGHVEICEGSTISNTATVTANTGEIVNWYTAPTGGNSIGTGTSYTDLINTIGTRTYYAETANTATTCISTTRTAVNFTVHPNPNAPTSNGHVEVCEGSTVSNTASVTVNTGETVNWFAAATGGTPLLQGTNTTSYTDPDTSVGPRTFYAETVNQTTGCVSKTRTAVTFTINALPNTPIGVSPGLVCDELDYNLNVNTPANTNIQINWYDTPNGGTPIQENSTTLNVTSSGTYYAEAININTGCISLGRTALSIDFSQTIVLDGEFLSFCQGESITLSAPIVGDSYLWNTGETSREITVSADGIYDVSIISLNTCPTYQIYDIEELESQNVVIEDIISDNRNIIVQVTNSNDFEYSLDGYDFQESPVFRNLQGGRYTIYIQSVNGCTSLSLEYVHLVIPKFFTPNGDGINEMFVPEGFENIEQYSMNIFDRYGKLLANYTNINNGWNGMYNNQVLPSSDYWYAINVNGEQFKGHVTLKR